VGELISLIEPSRGEREWSGDDTGFKKGRKRSLGEARENGEGSLPRSVNKEIAYMIIEVGKKTQLSENKEKGSHFEKRKNESLRREDRSRTQGKMPSIWK